MKKLLERIESARDFIATTFIKTDYDKGMKAGADTLIGIAKAYTPWIPVSELPPAHPEYEGSSIEVIVMNSADKMVSVGRYDFIYKSWESDYSPMNITHWTYLPELKL